MKAFVPMTDDQLEQPELMAQLVPYDLAYRLHTRARLIEQVKNKDIIAAPVSPKVQLLQLSDAN